MASARLIVPMACDALVVNNGVRNRDAFRNWPFNYLAFGNYRSPEPEAFDHNLGKPATGIYLHWTLPRALRHGVFNAKTGAVDYPVVPNRYLVVRRSGRTPRAAVAWVIEADCPYVKPSSLPSDRTPRSDTAGVEDTTLYPVSEAIVQAWKATPHPYRRAVKPNTDDVKAPLVNLGMRFPLGLGWRELAPTPMFLTAVAPANPLFSLFSPHNRGIFTFYDDVAGIGRDDDLSYLVVGWYSDPERDPVTACRTPGQPAARYREVRQALAWIVAEAEAQAVTDDTPLAGSLYHGTVCRVTWDPDGPPPDGDPLHQERRVNVALGNTTIDAFSGLIAVQLGNERAAKLLRAFQYDLLPVLDQVNGEALLEASVRQAWFGSADGGYSWAIVKEENESDQALTLTEAEAAWLARLNRHQARLDAALAKRHALQWELNGLWLKRGTLNWLVQRLLKTPTAVTRFPGGEQGFLAALNAQLNPDRLTPPDKPQAPESLAARLVVLTRFITLLLARLPRPAADAASPEEAMRQGIDAFAKANTLSPGKRLKAVAGPRAWLANNPVMVISGLDAPVPAAPDRTLAVRLSTRIVGADGDLALPDLAPLAPRGDLTGLPAGVAALITEFIILDPGGAAALAALAGAGAAALAGAVADAGRRVFQGLPPSAGMMAWRQPWTPMFAEWRCDYIPLPFSDAPGQGWWFDGSDYRWTGTIAKAAEGARPIGGISMLSAHAQQVFGHRLTEFVRKHGAGGRMKAVDQKIRDVYDWKFLSQELVGFNTRLALRDDRAFRRPLPQERIGSVHPVSLAGLLGYPDGDALLPERYRRPLETVPVVPNGPDLSFEGLRQGQAYLTDLTLYDRFGRQWVLIQKGTAAGLSDFSSYPVVIDEALRPTSKVVSVASVAQFPPRLLQHAKLDFRLRDGVNTRHPSDRSGTVNPIAGWVLCNHVNHSLLLFAPDGTGLGDVRLVVDENGRHRSLWQPPPDPAIATMAAVAARAPYLAKVLTDPAFAEPENFSAFLRVIDTSLWSIDQAGERVNRTLAVLVGRPLALVRAELQFQLLGPPLRDTGWAATFDRSDPAYLSRPFSIRLGDQETRQDGLIGYFLNDAYSVFHSVAPPGASPYLRQIGPPGSRKASADDQNRANYIDLTFRPNHRATVTMLVEPRGKVHATTGILPVKSLDIPPVPVNRALSAMDLGFRLGPVLTTVGPTPADDKHPPRHPLAVALPVPAVRQNGAWSWWEKNAGTAAVTGYDIVDPMVSEVPDPQALILREGVLTFRTNLSTQDRPQPPQQGEQTHDGTG